MRYCRYCLSIVAVLLFGCPAFAQSPYWGDQACSACHAQGPGSGMNQYNDYMQTGHPWKLVATNRQDPPVGESDAFNDENGHLSYPWGVPLPELPNQGTGDPATWADVDYIQGNFSSGHGYAIGTYIDDQQVAHEGYNINRGFTYSRCVKCHVTGYDAEGGPTNGITGSWEQPGIRCEECHGPLGFGQPHFAGGPLPDLDVARNACVRCHYGGDDVENIDFDPETNHWGHHPQAEQWLASPHYNVEIQENGESEVPQCALCHNPHRSTFFNDQYPEGEGGIKKQCVDCHEDKQGTLPEEMADLECIECHMQGQHFAHIFRITDQPIAAADNLDENGFWKKDENGQSFLTLDLVCLGCHGEGGEAEDHPLTLEEAAEEAQTIHTPPSPPLPPGDTWVLDTPAVVTFQPFVGILKWVQTIYPDGAIVRGMGFEVNGIIYWWNLDPQHFAVFYGRIDRNAGFMTGIQIARGRVTFFTGAQP